MIDNWWKAHEFEFLVTAILVGFILAIVGVYIIVEAIQERRARSKRLDEALRKVNAGGKSGPSGRDGDHEVVITEWK